MLCTLILSTGFVLSSGCGQSADEAARLSEQQQQRLLQTLIRVRVKTASEHMVDRTGAVTGLVAPFRKALVAAETGGRVVNRLVEGGDEVQSGQVLIVLDKARAALLLAQAKAQSDAGRVDVAQAKAEFERGQGLSLRSVISDDTLDALRFTLQRAQARLAGAEVAVSTAQRQLSDCEIKAPFSGIIELVHVQTGDFVNVSAPVVSIVDFSRARVIAGITASEAANLNTKGIASLSFEALGGTILQGQIKSLGRISDSKTGTYPVEIWLGERQAEKLREGMVASVELPLPSSEPNLVVPRSALFRKDGSMHLYTVNRSENPAVAQLRSVRTGSSNKQVVEILDGLSVGDLVVVDGLFALRDGAAVIIESADSAPQ